MCVYKRAYAYKNTSHCYVSVFNIGTMIVSYLNRHRYNNCIVSEIL